METVMIKQDICNHKQMSNILGSNIPGNTENFSHKHHQTPRKQQQKQTGIPLKLPHLNRATSANTDKNTTWQMKTKIPRLNYPDTFILTN